MHDHDYHVFGEKEAKEVLSKCELRGPIPMRVELQRWGIQWKIVAIAKTSDRDTGEEIDIVEAATIYLSYPIRKKELEYHAIDAAFRLYKYEFNENWYVNGVRVKDPHK